MGAPPDDRAEKLCLAIDMMDEGFALKKESLRRAFPGLTEAELEDRLAEWIASRPPDATGHPVPWPPRPR